MATVLRMPEVATGVESAVLIAWVVEQDAVVAIGDVVAEVETDKAVFDVFTEASGILRQLVPAGTEVDVGTSIALIGDDGDHQPRDADRPEPEGPTTPRPARVFASPFARKMAENAGLSIDDITGSGPNGRVVRADVERVLAARDATMSPAQPPTPTPAGRNARGHDSVRFAESNDSLFTDTPVSRFRRAIAARLTSSKQSVPHFYVRGTADVTKLLALRDDLNDGASERLTLTDFVVKGVALAHQNVPQLNVVWNGDSIRTFETVDIGVAVATEKGLLTPVVRGVHSMSIFEVSRAVRDLSQRARSGRVRQHELEGGSVSVTNLGMYGTEEFSAIINPPHASVLAVGAVVVEPRFADGDVRAAPVMHVVLSVDHRPVDGDVAARWMHAFLHTLTKPAKLIA
jgi:pyruvate dehydrogenase E2 component (dihydrolipoamide acetyltransferase)